MTKTKKSGGKKDGGSSKQLPWRKVLWRKNESQFFLDNYVSDSFFANLRVNQCLNQYSMRGMYQIVSHLLQYLFTIILFGLTWWNFYTDDREGLSEQAHEVVNDKGIFGIILNSGRMLVPVMVVSFARRDPTLSELLRPRSILCICGWLWFLAPISRTLTKSWSEDTIYTFVCLLAFFHLITADLTLKLVGPEKSFVFNSAFLLAVLLASRLSGAGALAIQLVAVELFAVFPAVRRVLFTNLPTIYFFVLTPVMFVAVMYHLASDELFCLRFLLAMVVAVIAVPCTLLLLASQRFKLAIQGPWDIPKTHINLN